MATKRVGLSEYTARRLAELRARRAEADDGGSFSSAIPSTQPDLPTSPVPTNGGINGTLELQNDEPANPLSNGSLGITTARNSSLISESAQTGSSNVSNDLTSSQHVSFSQIKLRSTAPPPIVAPTVAPPPVPSTPPPAAPPAVETIGSARQMFLSHSTLGHTQDQSTKVNGSDMDYVRPGGRVESGRVENQSVKEPSITVTPLSGLSSSSFGSTNETSLRTIPLNTGESKKSEAQCVGFSSLPEQLHRKAVKKGFDFTLMVVGESGLGKSTLISNLFGRYDLYNDRKSPEPALAKTVHLEKRNVEIEDHGIRVRLTVVDTPGFNDTLDSRQCWQMIVDYIEEQFEQYFRDETGLNRHNIKDTRVNCCLYFISPCGHGLRPIDIQLIQNLQNIVNVVPVIAKADTLTPMEMKRLKSRILDEIKANNLHTYQLPPCDDDEDDDYRARDKDMKNSWPFAVIGANALVEIGGRKVRGRVYPWGIVEAENPSHSDFMKLQQFLISTHLHDLKEVTCDVHYENFRVNCIRQQQEVPSSAPLTNSAPPVDDTERLLQQKEEEIRRMQQMMLEMQNQLSSAPRGQQYMNGRYTNGPS